MLVIKVILVLVSVLAASCSIDNSHLNIQDHKDNNMDTVKTQKPGTSSENNFSLKFNNDLSQLLSGEEINLSFSPIFKNDERKAVELDIIHEQKAHIIIISDDLDYFNHLHPSKENNGIYNFQVTLPYGGNYRMYVEYKPAGGDKITENFVLSAAGTSKQDKIFNKEKLSFKENLIEVIIKKGSEFISESSDHIPVEIIKDNKIVGAENLDNYLGEKAHAILIGLNEKKLLHVHPMVVDNKIYLHLNFNGIGFYRLWIQFKLNGILNTADFVLDVKPSRQQQKQSNNHHHNH